MKKRRTGFWGLLSVCVLFLLNGCGKQTSDSPEIRVTFFDVGKGDAILIETESHSVLIDSGYDDTSDIILDYLSERKIQRLDYMILTHFDKDHVGGADRILEAVDVACVLQPDYESDSKQYLEYLKTMKDKDMRAHLVVKTERLNLDGADFLIYPPQQSEYETEDNDFSLVISMTYGSRSFLFAGDCEEERLNELLSQAEFGLSHDVLKVPHHGRKEKNTLDFLSAVSPSIAVFTCPEDMKVKADICVTLENLGTKIYLTGKGTITCLCDGDTLQVIQEIIY
ncbi:MAG: MBL fold metallo-hydrolase [Lachnospiraceae bacterium]|nr:MBL fold metallo-hydrolase [Lachnospiraceae bacterium]